MTEPKSRLLYKLDWGGNERQLEKLRWGGWGEEIVGSWLANEADASQVGRETKVQTHNKKNKENYKPRQNLEPKLFRKH